MAIHSLRIHDFRNLSSIALTPLVSGLNIICGENGSGKTNLLEAIYYLSVARSFRQASTRSLIQHSQQTFSLFAQITSQSLDVGMPLLTIGMQKGLQGALRVKLGDQPLSSINELASRLPIQIIHSQSHHFFELGPIFRRKYLDWGLFYQSPHFLSCWHHYMRMLRQRNAALRQQRSKKEIETWTSAWINYANQFDSFRRVYVAELIPLILAVAEELLPTFPLQIYYYPGWEETKELTDLLFSAYIEEIRLGHTQFGPHRADLIITIQNKSARDILSRGQQKLLICAMMVAQSMLLTKQGKKAPIYLIDDLPAELDSRSRSKLLMLLTKQLNQIFITTIESQLVTTGLKDYFETPLKVFHVERGDVVSM